MRLFGYYPCGTCKHADGDPGCHRNPVPESPHAVGPWGCHDWELTSQSEDAGCHPETDGCEHWKRIDGVWDCRHPAGLCSGDRYERD